MLPSERFSADHRDLLLELSLLISERRGVDEIFASFADHVRHGITFDFTSLFVATADDRFIRSVGNYPQIDFQTAPGTIHRASEMGFDRLAVEVDGIEYIPRKVDLPSTRALAERGFQRSWVTPLFVDGQNYGMLTVAKTAHGAFPADHLAFLQAAATLLAKAVRQDLELELARRTAARAQAASELIFALQAHEPFDGIFERLPGLLTDALEADYIGLVISDGTDFVLGAESPAGVYAGLAPTEHGTAYIHSLAAENDFIQFKPRGDWTESLMDAGFKRGALSFLRDGDDLRGILVLARQSGRKFDTDEQRFIQLLRSILSQSLANQHRLQRTETEAARARTLNEVALLANAGEDVEAIFQRLVGLLDEAVDIDYLGLYKVTEDADTLVMVGSNPEVVRPAGTLVTRADVALDGIINLERTVAQYRVANFSRLTQFEEAMKALEMRRSATVLIHQGGELQGVLSLARRKVERFTPEEESFLATLGAMLGQAIANRRRLNAAQTDAARNRLLNQLAILLNDGEPAAAFFQSLSAQMRRVVPFDGLALLVTGDQPGMLRVVDSSRGEEFKKDQLVRIEDFGESVLARLAAGETVVEGDATRTRGHISTSTGAQNIGRGAVAAIQHAGERLGFFLIGRTGPAPFTAEECAFLELVCVLVGQAIANRKKVEEKEAAAIRSQVLSELAVLLQGGDRIENHFDSLCRIMLQAVGFDFISIGTKDPATGEFGAIRTHDLLDAGEPIAFQSAGIDVLVASGGTSLQYATRGGEWLHSRAMAAAGFERAASALIVSPDGPHGVFTIGRRNVQPFSEDEMSFIELVSVLLGQAAANYQKAYARDAEALRSRILSELAILLNNGEPIDAHFQRLRELLFESVGFDYCSIAVRMPNGEGFRAMRSEPLTRDSGEIPAIGEDAIAAILATGGFSGQYGPEAADFGAPREMFEVGINRGASFVLTTGAEPEGLLTIGRRSPEPFTLAEMALFEVVGSLLAYAAANERRLSLTAAEAEDQTIIAEAAAAVARETTPLAIVRGLRAAVGRFIPSPFVNFGYLEGDAVRFPSRTGRLELMAIDQHFSRAFAEGQHVVPSTASRLAAHEPNLEEVLWLGIESHVLTRASSTGAANGLLVIGSREPEFSPGERELRLCRLVADIVGPAMANAAAVERERIEAEEQRAIAEVAAVAAREAEPGAMVSALQRPMALIVPRPFLAFGYLEGEEVAFPRPDGTMARFPLDEQSALTEKRGQIVWPEVPELFLRAEDMRPLGIKVICSTSVRSGGNTVGFILIGSRTDGYEFRERELRIIRLIAQIVGPAMENARATLRARLDAEEQRFLARAAAAVAGATDEAALAQALSESFAGLIPDARVSLSFREHDSDMLTTAEGRIRIGPQAARAFEAGQSQGRLEDTEISDRVRTFMNKERVRRWIYTATTSGGDASGLLWVATRDESYEFTDRDRRFCRLVADFAGPALANLRESASRRQEAEEQRLLADAAAAVATSASEEGLIEALQTPIQAIIPAGRLLFYYLDGDSFRLPGRAVTFPRGPHASRALAEGQSFGETEGPDVSDEMRDFLRGEGVVRWAYTTATSGGEVQGLFVVTTGDKEYRFGDRVAKLLRLIADFAGPAMANLRESARRQQEADEQRILAEAAAALAAGASESDILNGLVRPIRSIVPRARVAFSYVEGNDMVLWDGRNRRPIHDLSRKALETGQIVGKVATTEMTEASRELLQAGGVVSYCDTAATSGGAQIGLLFIGSPDPAFEFSEADRRMLRLIADITGPAMANAREDRRRRQEAEDERILSEIGAIAARAVSSAELIESLGASLEALIPQAFALYGVIEGDAMTYHITRPADRKIIGTDELSLPMTSTGRAARDTGQATGSLAGVPDDAPYAALALQAYALTCYFSAGAPVGALMVSTRDSSFAFDDRSLALLKRVVQVVGPAVESSRAEAELARQAELYSLMLRSLSEGVILSDLQGNVVFANELGRDILRALDPSGNATTWMEIIPLLPEDAQEGYRGVYEDGIGARGRAALEVNGRTTWFEYELVPLNDPVMKVLVVAADVTADVEREEEQARHRDQMEQAQRLAALGELIGGVAHELNNPLTAILGFAEVMSLSPVAGELKEELAIVQKEALRARNIVRDLLFIVKPGTSERSVIPVSELIAHIERLRRAAWVQQGIRWEIDLEQPCMVWGNEHQLTQVILNLVTNAEHALAGRAEKHITIRATSHADRTEISVADTGAGMDEATRGRVFEPFFTTKQGHGTGLGLPLSYSIVQAHDGEVRIESSPGEGTTFTIVLPAAPDSPSEQAIDARLATTGVVRVLVVDDEPSLRKVCQRLIASMGHECSIAENSAAAIALATTADFDVVLCDYRLGSETANDVVAGFEQVAPQLISRMVIATGATTDAGVVELTERHGLRLIAKPYGVDELATIIQRPAAPAA